MNVYDFDNTIYNGESTFDFYLFCVGKNLRKLKYMYPVVSTLILYKMCRIDIDTMIKKAQKYMTEFIEDLDNPKELICEFWDKNEHKIKKFYLEQKKNDDVIISASPDILLAEICQRLGIKNLIATEIDIESKTVNMCYGKNKVDLFCEKFNHNEIDRFYTDSKNDIPMAKIAKKAFFVKGNKISEWNIQN